MDSKGTKNKPDAKKDDKIEVVGLEDFHLVAGDFNKKTGKSAVDIRIKKDKKAMVPKSFVDGLKRNKVIK
jgi:hypothetical protein